jgi:thiol-disulfide isomerase/thioredoxin
MVQAVELNQQTQKECHSMLQGGKPTLILIHANWCPHCVALQPAWTAAKNALVSEKGINIIEVEYTYKSLLPANFPQPNGFPTIEVVRSGKVVSEYTGDRSPKSFVNYALSHASKPKKPVAKAETKQILPKKRKAAQAPTNNKRRNILKNKKL